MNGEQWMKVMDEYIAPKCAAVMELGRKFYCSWTTRRRTLAGWLVNTTRQCGMAQSSFNRRVHQISLSLLDFFVERAQDTTRSASSSCQFSRIAGTRWMFEKIGAAWVRRLQACVGAKTVFTSSTEQ